jgi:F420-dependent oxidoreductase-like protein
VKVSIGIGGAAVGSGLESLHAIEYAVEAERLGVDVAWTAEGWGTDAVAPLAYLAAKTRRMKLGTGILQVSARTPAMTAMTALTLDGLSEGRFLLGLGASGPQVVEGLHSTRFDRPITRLRENIELIRQAFRGERLQLDGHHYQLPTPGGQARAMRLGFKPRELPIYLATVAPKGLELTGELAQGWLGTSFMPEASEAHFEHLRCGASRAGRKLAEIDLCAGGAVAISDDVEGLIARRRPQLAFTLGAMGSEQTNFYFGAYSRAGFADACAEVQRLWLSGDREEAARQVPEAMILRSGLFGSEDMIRDRIRAYRDVGITTLRLDAQGKDMNERLETLGHAIDWVRAADAH